METERPRQTTARFGVFQANLATSELFKRGIRIRLQDQPFTILRMLLERPGDVVTREELRSRLWAGRSHGDFDHSLNIAVNKLRDALGDPADNPRFVETLPRRGYRFLVPVTFADEHRRIALADVLSEEQARIVGADSPGQGRGWLVWGGAIVMSLVVFLLLWARPRANTPPGAGRVMLAVLPFLDLTEAGGQDYFIGGLNEEMIARLGRLHPSRLGVIARTSVQQYRDTNKTIQQIGSELRVGYVLEGSVRRLENRVRITSQLIRVSDQTQMWAQEYERPLVDVFAIQSDVARNVADSLRLELLPTARAEMEREATKSSAAYEAYLLGRHFWSLRTEGDFRKAIAKFEEAIRADPGYALAYVGLADAHSLLAGYGYVPAHVAMPKAKQAVRRALELQESLPEAHATVAAIAQSYDWDWALAEREYRRTFELDPNYANAHLWYAHLLAQTGRFEEALAEVRKAMALDPLSMINRGTYGAIQIYARQYQAAAESCQAVIQIDPNFLQAYLCSGVAYTQMGKYPRAIELLEKARILSQGAELADLGSAYALAGDRRAAQEILLQLRKRSTEHYVSPTALARVYVALGDKEQALAWLEQAYQERSFTLAHLKVAPEFDVLRSDPRFGDLLRRVGLPE